MVKKKRTIRTNVQVDTVTVGLSGKQLSVNPYCPLYHMLYKSFPFNTVRNAMQLAQVYLQQSKKSNAESVAMMSMQLLMTPQSDCYNDWVILSHLLAFL